MLHQNQGIGQIIGSGSLRAYDRSNTPPVAIASTQPFRISRTDSQPDLLITWHDRVDLTFYRRNEEPQASAQRNAGGILALKDALFRGSVHTQHTQFDLTSDLMTVALNKPHDTWTGNPST